MFKKWELYIKETGELAYNANRFIFKGKAQRTALILNQSMIRRGVSNRTYDVRKR